MAGKLSVSAQRVQDALAARGMSYQVVELPDTTRTAVEAAQAIGCTVGQIAKSLLFKTRATGKPILVIASGPNRVNEKRLAALVGEPIERPDADYVRLHTGFVIGGVPPLGHVEPLDCYIDEDLAEYSEIWAAAGNPRAVFCLKPADLPAMTGGRFVPVK